MMMINAYLGGDYERRCDFDDDDNANENVKNDDDDDRAVFK